MIQSLRTLKTALFLMSLFFLASCGRNTNGWSCCQPKCEPCCYTPTRYKTCPPPPCPQPCAPSGQFCGQPCPPPPGRCAPCAPVAQPCAPVAQPCAPTCAPRAPSCGTSGETNPYFPCDSQFYPCGGNQGCSGTGGQQNLCGIGQCGGVFNPPFPGEVCYGTMVCYDTCDDCNVRLVQRAPEYATVGAPYPIEIEITAIKECANVEVSQVLPCDSVFLRSDPPAQPLGQKLTWSFPHMVKGECQKLTVWVKPEKEGCCLTETTICACPQLCAYTNCVQPIVCITKCGPACACLNCPICYTVQVCNSGSGTAYDVVVCDTIPDGLVHESGQRCLTYQLGNLCPGDSRTLSVNLCAVKRGMVCNTASVKYCGGPICTAEACTMVNEPCVEISKTGPDWAYICKTVDYTITVTNPGDLILRDVEVVDFAPAGTLIVDAPGAEICCNKAVWNLCELCPGETKTFCVSLRSQVSGNLCNRVEVTTCSDCGPCTECAEVCTLWKGIPAIHMCMVDTNDPICVGDTTVYRVCITNQGTADDTNVQLVIRFTNELQPQSSNGPTPGNISGNTVTFAPIGILTPKQSVEYCVTVKGVGVGDGRAEATLSSDMLSSPVIDVESTHVY